MMSQGEDEVVPFESNDSLVHLEYLSVGITAWPPGAEFAEETYSGAEGVYLTSSEDANSWGTDWLQRSALSTTFTSTLLW